MDLGRSTMKLFLTQAGRAVMLFVGITFFARQIPPDRLGAFFLFQAMLGLLLIPGDMGIRGALEKRLSEGKNEERLLGSALAVKLVTLSIVSLGILATREHVNAFLGADLAVLLVVTLAVYDLSWFFVQTLRGELRVGETAIIQFARRFVWIALSMILVTAGYGVRGIVFGLIGGSVLALVWAFWKCDTAIGVPSYAQTSSLIAFSKYQMITSVGGRVYQWMDVAIVGFFLANQYVSAYEVAWQITLLVLLLSNSIAWSMFPQISQWTTESETDKIEGTLSSAIGFALFLSIPAFVGGSVYSAEILEYLFGPEYTIAALVFIVLLAEKLFQSFNDIIESSIRAIDRPDLAAKATVITVGLNLILSPLLALTVGFVGVAVATTVSWFVNTVLHTRYLSRLISIEIPYLLLGWYALTALAMGLVLVVLKSVLPVTNPTILVFELGIGAVIYLGFSVVIPDIRNRTIIPGIRVLV